MVLALMNIGPSFRSIVCGPIRFPTQYAITMNLSVLGFSKCDYIRSPTNNGVDSSLLGVPGNVTGDAADQQDKGRRGCALVPSC